MKHYNVRGRLIDRTISVIADAGLDKTTTKAIVKGTNIPEAYIYQYFNDKEELLAAAFEALDKELVSKALLHISVMYMRELEYEERCRMYFSEIWDFLLGNREKCIAFVRYYYSPYFENYSLTQHKDRYAPLIEKFSDAFSDTANTWMLLNHILNVMLDFSVKVFSGALENDGNTAEYVFRLVFHSVKQYFKE